MTLGLEFMFGRQSCWFLISHSQWLTPEGGPVTLLRGWGEGHIGDVW